MRWSCADAEVAPSLSEIDLALLSFVHSPFCFYVTATVRNLGEKSLLWSKAACFSGNLECFQMFVFPVYRMWFG